MSNQIKLEIGSSFAVATLIFITMGSASAQQKICIQAPQPVQTQQQPQSLPSQFSRPGYIRGK